MPRQQYLFLGSKFQAITGYDPRDILRLTASEFMPLMIPADHLKLLMLADAEAFRVLRAQFNGGYEVQINSDMTMIRKDGSSIRVMLQSRPLIWDEEGNIKVSGGFIVDISHIKLHGLPSTTLVSEGEVIYSYQPSHKELVEHKISEYSLRELELISMMAQGDDVDDLIGKTGLSKATIYAHRRNILAKSELPTMQKVIESLRKQGLLD
jgi:DNA-binding CsgD family transcriptional regulator